MVARITTGTTGASVSRVKPRLSVTVVNPTTSVSRVVPASEISYVYLVLAAGLDSSGLYQYKGETLSATDALRYVYAKALADIASLADTPSIGYSKPATDSLTATDSSVLSSTLNKTEALTATDTNAIGFTLAPVVESLSVPDSQVLTPALSKADSVTMSDSAYVVLIFLRDVFDSVTATDTPAILFSAPYVETLTATDTSSYSFNQQLTDAFGMNDLADVGDGIAFDFVDFTANVVTMSDNQTLQVSPTYSDTISPSDAGVGSIQDYCDITYFAEDYVGSRFTF